MRTIDEMIAVMQAFKEGKKIEIRREGDDEGDDWVDICCPKWNWHGYDYRVKPEPKYRPYANAEEAMEAIKKHEGWVFNKDSDFILITACTDKYVWLNGAIQGISYDRVYEDCVWADDGSPCGVLEE